jgi:hypothetical protein
MKWESWCNPRERLPNPKQCVLIAAGIPMQQPEYHVARYSSSGCFNIRNGAYSDSSLYPIGFNNGTGNAVRVLAWAAISEYEGEFDLLSNSPPIK